MDYGKSGPSALLLLLCVNYKLVCELPVKGNYRQVGRLMTTGTGNRKKCSEHSGAGKEEHALNKWPKI